MRRIFCAIWDHIEYAFILLLFVGVFYLAFTSGSPINATTRQDDPNYYANKIFNRSYVHKVEVSISDENLQELLSNPIEKGKYHVTAIVDGERFDDVAFSIRGNGSVGTIFEDENSNRFNYTINFKKFNSRQSYHGLDKLILSGLYFEPSYLRSALAFMLTESTGLSTPLFSFTELYVNGEQQGLYLAVEAIDRSFLERTGATSDATLFHPVPYDVDLDRRQRDAQYLSEDEQFDVGSHQDSSSNTYGGSDLTYRGNDVSSYNSIFMNSTTKYSRADEMCIINGIESLSEISAKNPEDYWDIDALIKFFSASALIYNTDSYLGILAQNYYLQTSNGKLSLIPWDFDRAFTDNGFESASKIDEKIISWPIDDLTFEATTDEYQRPAWRLIKNNPTYLEKYHEVIQKVLDDYLLNGECRRDYDALVELIRPYVYTDPTRTHSTEDFEDEVKYLSEYIILRADSLQRQLWDIDARTRDK